MKRLLAVLAAVTFLIGAQPASASILSMRVRGGSAAAYTYSPGAIGAGLTAVEALTFNGVAGTNAPLTNTPTSHAQSLGSCTVSGINVFCTTAGTVTLSDWDFSDYVIWLGNSVTVTCTNCKFRARNDQGFMIGAAQDAWAGTAPNWICNHCTVDATVYDIFGGEAPVKWNGTGNETWNYTFWTNSSRDMISHNGGGALNISWNYFGGICMSVPGVANSGTAHCEHVHHYAGLMTIDHSVFDQRPVLNKATAGITGTFNLDYQGSGTIPSTTISSTVFIGVDQPSTVPNCHALDSTCTEYSGGSFWLMSVTGGVVTVTGSSVGRGRAGYITSVSSTITGSGNYDTVSGLFLGNSSLP